MDKNGQDLKDAIKLSFVGFLLLLFFILGLSLIFIFNEDKQKLDIRMLKNSYGISMSSCNPCVKELIAHKKNEVVGRRR